jgi:fumarylacetoacetase
MPPGAAQPSVGPCKRLDIELELGIFMGAGNALGESIPIDEAESHVFGLCLLNDWSARDIQAWEYQPLGPFLGKSFLTTVSPWVVTLEALAPFRIAAARPAGDPALLPYLQDDEDRKAGGLAITMEVQLRSARMREQGKPPVTLARAPFASQYWTLFQMLAHHTSNGCNLLPGDLIATGTVSGPDEGQQGCLLEFTHGGARPFELDGEKRSFLEDGDEVVLRASAVRPGATRIGFGECRGIVVPAA